VWLWEALLSAGGGWSEVIVDGIFLDRIELWDNSPLRLINLYPLNTHEIYVHFALVPTRNFECEIADGEFPVGDARVGIVWSAWIIALVLYGDEMGWGWRRWWGRREEGEVAVVPK
jgi:hypothetical protein